VRRGQSAALSVMNQSHSESSRSSTVAARRVAARPENPIGVPAEGQLTTSTCIQTCARWGRQRHDGGQHGALGLGRVGEEVEQVPVHLLKQQRFHYCHRLAT
jgi:hypothetical protein